MPRIFDNIEQRLLATLGVSSHADFYLGYFTHKRSSPMKTDLTFFTNEPGSSLPGRFKKT